MKPVAALWRLAISAVIAIVLLSLIFSAIQQPGAPDNREYTADFTDASGLHKDADVRVRGVRVGKVKSVQLRRREGASVAAVSFVLDKRYGVVPATRLAIKYQDLTGTRYVDVIDPAENYMPADLVTHATAAMTRPSFDITSLFNGLQPVIATLSPEEINTFTANAESYLSGDGGGLESMLDSIRKLTEFLSNRQQVIATLMRNLAEVAHSIGGDSSKLIQLLDWANRPLDGALEAIDEFRKTELFGSEFNESAERLFTNIGFPAIPGANSRFRLHESPVPTDDLPSDIDLALDRAFTNVDNYTDAFKLVPVVWENIPEPPAAGAPLPCSRGRFELPAPMDIFVNGQKVVLCNR